MTAANMAAQTPEQKTPETAKKEDGGDKTVPTRHDVIVVTATRTETDVLDLPVSVGIVRQSDVEQQLQLNNQNVGEVVRGLPGVSVGAGNRNIPAWIQLRGTGYFIGRTLYMVDELPLAEPMVSIAVNPANLATTEVLLGPASSLYGANASGGVVNMRSASARESGGITLSGAYGTFGTWRPRVSVGKSWRNWDFLGSYNLDTSDGYKNTDLATGLYLMKNNLPSYLNSVTIADQYYTNNYSYQRVGYRDPNSGRGFTLGAHVFTEDLYGGKQNSSSNGTRVIGTGSFFTPVGHFGMLTVRFGYQSRLSDSQSTKGLSKVLTSAINGRYVFTAIDSLYSYVYDPTISLNGHTTYTRLPVDVQMDVHPLRGHTLTMGATYLADQSRSFTLNADKSLTTAKTKYAIGQSAVYVQDQYRFADERATLVLGVRHDWWKYHDIYDSGSTNKTPDDVDKGATTARGGIKYRLTDSVGLRASVGTAYWPGNASWFFQNVSTGTTWREANGNLKPETTRMVDFGTDFVDSGARTRLSVTGYFGQIRDAMSYVYAQHPTLAGVQIIRTSNSDQVSIKGLELGLRRQLRPNLTLNLNYTLNRSEITRSATNKGHQLRNAPDNVGSAGLVYENRRHQFGVALTSQASDSRYYDDENTQLRYYRMRGYVSPGAKVWKDIAVGANKLTLSLGVDNLTNTKYDGEFIYNAPGRFAEVRATYHFGL
jgi:outer membrane receptor protein involved in Fe transport